MFGIGSTELLVILVVALIVLGPKSLANVSRTLGKAMGEFRRVSTDFQRTLTEAVRAHNEPTIQCCAMSVFGLRLLAQRDTNGYSRVVEIQKNKCSLRSHCPSTF